MCGLFKIGGAVAGLFVLLAGLVAALIAFVVFVFALLAVLAAVGSAVTAYVKRDSWTKPAYRWARDKSGRWSMIPWNAGEAATPEEDAPLA